MHGTAVFQTMPTEAPPDALPALSHRAEIGSPRPAFSPMCLESRRGPALCPREESWPGLPPQETVDQALQSSRMGLHIGLGVEEVA